MRILHVITTLDVGGAEMHLLQQVTGQCARGHQVRVAWLKGEGRLASDFERAGAKIAGRCGPLKLIRELLSPNECMALCVAPLLRSTFSGAGIPTCAERDAATEVLRWLNCRGEICRCSGTHEVVQRMRDKLPPGSEILPRRT